MFSRCSAHLCRSLPFFVPYGLALSRGCHTANSSTHLKIKDVSKTTLKGISPPLNSSKGPSWRLFPPPLQNRNEKDGLEQTQFALEKAMFSLNCFFAHREDITRLYNIVKGSIDENYEIENTVRELVTFSEDPRVKRYPKFLSVIYTNIGVSFLKEALSSSEDSKEYQKKAENYFLMALELDPTSKVSKEHLEATEGCFITHEISFSLLFDEMGYPILSLLEKPGILIEKWT